MTTTDLAQTISEAVQGSAWARPNGDDETARAPSNGDNVRAEWQHVIDDVLSAWGRRQELCDEDAIEWPAPAIVEIACRLAASLQSQGLRAPTRVVPNAEGGLVFEYEHKRELQTIEIEADGTIELCRFDDAKLTNRSRLPAASMD